MLFIFVCKNSFILEYAFNFIVLLHNKIQSTKYRLSWSYCRDLFSFCRNIMWLQEFNGNKREEIYKYTKIYINKGGRDIWSLRPIVQLDIHFILLH